MESSFVTWSAFIVYTVIFRTDGTVPPVLQLDGCSTLYFSGR